MLFVENDRNSSDNKVEFSKPYDASNELATQPLMKDPSRSSLKLKEHSPIATVVTQAFHMIATLCETHDRSPPF